MLIPISKKNLVLFDKSNIKEDVFGHHLIFYLWTMFLAEGSLIIVYFLDNNNNSTNTKITVRNSNFKQFSKVKLSFLILLITLMDFGSTFGSNLYVVSGAIIFETVFKIFNLILTMLLTKKILKYSYHRHHAVGLFILILGVIFNSVVDYIYLTESSTIKKNFASFAIYFIIGLSSQILGSLQEVLEKYLMDTIYIAPFLLIYFEGIAGTFLLGVFLIIFGNIKCPNIKGKDNSFPFYICEKENSNDLVYIENFIWCMKFLLSHFEYILSYVVTFTGLFLFNKYRMLTIYYYSPIHKSMSNILKLFIFWIWCVVIPFYERNTIGYNIFTFLSFCLMFFGVLVFLEIIIMIWIAWSNNHCISRTIRKIPYGYSLCRTLVTNYK